MDAHCTWVVVVGFVVVFGAWVVVVVVGSVVVVFFVVGASVVVVVVGSVDVVGAWVVVIGGVVVSQSLTLSAVAYTKLRLLQVFAKYRSSSWGLETQT